MARGNRACTTRTAGLSTVAAGLWLLGVGLWARADVRRSLARERIISTDDETRSGQPVKDAAAARSLAEVIRGNTLSATESRTYGETPSYVDAERRPTTDRTLAAKDAVTGEPVENPEHALWVEATTLQTALMQAYLAQRLAEVTAGLGATFVAVGAGLTAASRR